MLKKFLMVGFAAVALPAWACSPIFPDFADALENPNIMVVLGEYEPKTGTSSQENDSDRFRVTEVLRGNLPAQTYQLVMNGPWGSMCERYNMAHSGSTLPSNNPVVLLVEKRVDANTLNLPFAHAEHKVSNDKLTTARRFDMNNGVRQRLDRPQYIQMSVFDLKKWLANKSSTPAPWQKISSPSR